MFLKTNRVFLDYASTTPVDKKVVKEMLPYFSDKFYNASSLYEEGILNRKVIDNCREKIAKIVQSKSAEVIFTAGGTESANLAIIGVARAIKKKLIKNNLDFKPHILVSNIEHVAVLESCKYLETEGFDVEYLKVNDKGIFDENLVYSKIRKETILISVMFANNEIGTIFPIRKISVAISKYKKNNNKSKFDYPYLHTDASQAPNYLNININQIAVDLMTLDGSKIYGPKGCGVLVKRSFVPIESIIYGGSHEFGIRPGTENLPLIVGFTKALEICVEKREQEFERLFILQKYFFEQIQNKFSETKINGDLKNRLPNNVNFCIPNLNAEFAVIQLAELGICCASTTSCKNLSSETSSYVIESINPGCQKSSLRFTMGRKTVKKHIDFTIQAIQKILKTNIYQ
ncbi:MAG TPA: cysteine desulfurase family protein [Candidatus Paceibacterota bacterium]|nr:cysteine desulfurase family protein [Candidatus Paceibacterota bacterium]HMP18814.1 cysteine desulfurase family protein [Candidatus Paceibacterota bacterium]HMP85412.1 cysteine desulfurase family protein [Candidatus Paceibacterota bacterium]